MISFIVIGRNEERNIERCILSVLETINVNKLTDAEILFIDSNSSDNTVAIVQKYPQVSIYKITRGWNLPVARNIGANNAKGDVLFFLDGDMAMDPSFIAAAVNDGKPKYDFVTGNLYEYQYNSNNELVQRGWREKSSQPQKKIHFTCGLFAIKRHIWYICNGMDTRMRKGADSELCMRLYRANVVMYHVNVKCADHYTINYVHHDRMWSALINGDTLYARSVLYRKHIALRPIIMLAASQDYTAIIMVASLILSILFQNVGLIFLYILTIVVKAMKQYGITQLNKLELIPYYILRDLTLIVGFFFFYPRMPKYEYNQIRTFPEMKCNA